MRARCAGLGSVKDGVIMMLVSYRTLAVVFWFALLERYMPVVRGDKAPFLAIGFIPFYTGPAERCSNCTATGSAMTALAALW